MYTHVRLVVDGRDFEGGIGAHCPGERQRRAFGETLQAKQGGHLGLVRSLVRFSQVANARCRDAEVESSRRGDEDIKQRLEAVVAVANGNGAVRVHKTCSKATLLPGLRLGEPRVPDRAGTGWQYMDRVVGESARTA